MGGNGTTGGYTRDGTGLYGSAPEHVLSGPPSTLSPGPGVSNPAGHGPREPDRSRIKNLPKEPRGFGPGRDDLQAEMMVAIMGDPFPRKAPLEIFVDDGGYTRATVPHHATYHVPDTIHNQASDQYFAGPEAYGHPGIYEMSLSVMIFYLPAGFDAADDYLVLGSARPRPMPVPVSRPAWELHLDFADEVLSKINPEKGMVGARTIYDWVAEKRADLAGLVTDEPTNDPFERLF